MNRIILLLVFYNIIFSNEYPLSESRAPWHNAEFLNWAAPVSEFMPSAFIANKARYSSDPFFFFTKSKFLGAISATSRFFSRC